MYPLASLLRKGMRVIYRKIIIRLFVSKSVFHFVSSTRTYFCVTLECTLYEMCNSTYADVYIRTRVYRRMSIPTYADVYIHTRVYRRMSIWVQI